MFFFLIFHTKVSSSNDIEKKLITTMVYGTVLYIMFHVMLNSSQKPFFLAMRQYFWLLLLIDIIAVLIICRSILAKMSDQTKGSLSGVGKKIYNYLEGIIDTGIYTDNVNFDNQTDDVITDIEAVKRRAGILKQTIANDPNTNGSKVTFADTDQDSVASNIDPRDAGGNIINREELQQVEDLINSLTMPYDNTNTDNNTNTNTNTSTHGIGSTPITSILNDNNNNTSNNININNDTYNNIHEDRYDGDDARYGGDDARYDGNDGDDGERELPPALRPQYTVPRIDNARNDGRRILRNPLQSDLAPRDDKPLPPPECVTPDRETTETMKQSVTYNPNIWDNDMGDENKKNNKLEKEPDFSKPLPSESIYMGIGGRKRSDDTRSEVSEFDIDLSDFENSL